MRTPRQPLPPGRGRCVVCRTEVELQDSRIPLVGKIATIACEKHKDWVQLGLKAGGAALKAGAVVAIESKAPGMLDRLGRIWDVWRER
jgi:hypothetical protein